MITDILSSVVPRCPSSSRICAIML
jgi:hypothetical protein